MSMEDVVKKSAVTAGPWARVPDVAPDLDMGFNARRLRANLVRNEPAMRALAALGIEPALVARAGLGMKESSVTAAGLDVSGVVTYPLDLVGARRRYGYVALPGITVNPDHPVAWSPGDARPVAFGTAGTLLVVANPFALLQARSVIEARGVACAAVASSQPDRIPAEWYVPSYWARWERVILDHSLPPTVKAGIAEVAGRPLEVAAGVVLDLRSSPPASALEEWLDCLLEQARPLAVEVSPDDHPGGGIGDFEATAISLHGGVADGRMYYPFMVERRREAGRGGMMGCSYETMVLRSDGGVVEARTLPAPAGTPASQRVHCLTDGTRIAAPPVQSRHATWSFGSIQRFIADRAACNDPVRRPASEIMVDIHDLLASRVSLPDPSDFWVAASFAMLTHMFRLFPAIPLLLIEGPRASGKSELASAIASVGFNAVTMGQGSAAALVRVSQECGGLVVLDDVEGLSAGGTGFGELSQCLKVGYRASTARKPITLGSGRVGTFDFYGPRVLTCTRGVEPILGSRCVSIHTVASDAVVSGSAPDPESLRDELHALGMTSTAVVTDAFIAHSGAGRADEIWAPLLAIAEALGPAQATRAVAAARKRHVA